MSERAKLLFIERDLIEKQLRQNETELKAERLRWGRAQGYLVPVSMPAFRREVMA